uniref:E2 ubiquitin-conjugating enzyme n=1 Tax=Rhipicephalus appendiculatus TaxID=34631 RepID=A0A131YRA4_RHIAP
MAAAAGRGETAAETYSYDRNAGDGHGPIRGAALPVSSCPVSTVAMARIRRELEEIRYSPLTNCSAGPVTSGNLFKWTATIVGPEETPYEGGVFLLDITFPEDYPFNPPMVKFTTKIYHINIVADKVICLDILKTHWTPALTVSDVLLSLWCLLKEPYADDPADQEVAAVYKENRTLYESTARKWTAEHAKL